MADQENLLFDDIDKFKRSLSITNKAEIIAGSFGVTIFLLFTYLFREAPILTPIGSVLCAFGVLYIIRYIFVKRIVRGDAPSRDNPIEFFEYSVIWYRNSHKMSRSVFWWYILPVIPGYIIFTIGLSQVNPKASIIIVCVNSFIGLFVGGIVLWLNRFYVSKKMAMKINEIEKWLSDNKSK